MWPWFSVLYPECWGRRNGFAVYFLCHKAQPAPEHSLQEDRAPPQGPKPSIFHWEHLTLSPVQCSVLPFGQIWNGKRSGLYKLSKHHIAVNIGIISWSLRAMLSEGNYHQFLQGIADRIDQNQQDLYFPVAFILPFNRNHWVWTNQCVFSHSFLVAIISIHWWSGWFGGRTQSVSMTMKNAPWYF